MTDIKEEAAECTSKIKKINFGNHWAVLKNQRVIVFPMYVASNMPVDKFAEYRNKIHEALKMLGGKVMTGELIEEESNGIRQRFFVKKQNGKQRTAGKPPQKFKLYNPGFDQEEKEGDA
ncbi:hypothetical protein [uncultured Microbulbifer sp.]|uniref:hypothetical protein n=1 Tax=uncultured Microbulbifer sp. TaxID=348147 RepID=UPI00260C4966|nr:hypothetical protein [uncultured Microbulbifer sp.]